MDKNKRSTLVALATIGLGYTAFRYVPSLIPETLELEPMVSPAGFRKYVAGESSGGGFDPFVGLEEKTDSAAQTAQRAADARVQTNICDALYGELDLTPTQVPMASFSDYYCPFCRLQTKRLADLAQTRSREISVAWHELPLLGENSNLAAKAALAAKRQGAYIAFHDRLMRTPFSATPEYLSRLAIDIGVDEEQLIADMSSEEIALQLQDSAALSRAFSFFGTPALVIGRTVVQGQISDRMIDKIIRLEREEGWATQCAQV